MHKHLLTSIAAAMLPLSAQGAIAQASGSYSYLGSRSRDAALSSAIHHSSQQSYNKLDDKSDTQLQVISAQHSLFLTPFSTSEKALDLTIQQHTQPDEILNADIERVNVLELVENYQVNELIIIDQAVPDKHLFYKALKPGGEIREIDSSKDGLEQLKAILANYQNLNALHIVSHADDGVVFLGSSNVNEELLREEVNTLATMNKAMKDGADVFFYGCNLAKSEKGEALLELIQGEANVDVAASNNLTGNMKQGGDWQLEIVKGDISSEQPFSDIAVRDFSHTLAPEVYTSGSFCVAGCGTPSTSLTSSDGHFLFTGSASGSGENVHAYNTFRPDDGMYFDYQTSLDGDTTGFFNFAADGVTVGSFELTGLVYSTYYGTCSGGSVVGYVSGGGTVSNSLTWSGTNTSATLSNFSGVQITHFRVNGSGCSTSVYQGMGVRSFTVDNKQASTDSDGSLTAAGTVSEPVAINTTVDSVGEAVDVFDFTLSDGGSSDGLAMGVSQIVLNVSGTTTDIDRAKVTWRLNGNDASNVTGVYNAGADTITFSGLSVSVADTASETYTVNVYYNDNSAITENKTFILSIDGDTDLTVGSNGTQMGSTTVINNGSGGTFDVTASALVFSTQPSGSVSGAILTTQPVIRAEDAFGNTDIDFTETVTLTEASLGSLSSSTVAASSGVATFSNLNYTATADQQSFTLTANDQDGVGSNLATVDANAVTSDVVATQLAFSTQPDPLFVKSSSATSFSTVPVVNAVDSNGIVDTGYSTGISLAEVNGTGSALMSTTGDTDGSGATVTITPSSGIATFTAMQVTYTASGGSSENFNLQASSGGLITASSSQLTGLVSDSDGSLTSAIGVSEPVGINTTVDTTSEAVDIFDFTLSDGGTVDGQAMTVSQVVVNVSGTTTDVDRAKVTWRLNGNDAINVTGVYNAGSDTITFSGLSISIANGGSETYTVNVYYNDNSAITENKTFILSIDGDTDLTVGPNGTQMGATSAITNGAGSSFDIVATQLAFTTQPSGSVSGVVLTTQPVIMAQDAFGNTDIDFTETVTLTEGSAGSLSSNTTAASSGVATFSNLNYTATADQQSFTLTANDQDGVGSNLTTVDASVITSDVVATQLSFDTQPTPTTLLNGVLTNFTTVPVVSALDNNGLVDTGYSTAITLAEINGAGSVTLSGTGDTDGSGATVTITPSSGVATFTGIAINYSVSGNIDETFNIQAASGALTNITSSQLTVTVNTAPILTNLTTSYVIIEDVASAINLSAVTFADTEGDNLTVTLAVNSGTIASTDGSVSIGGVTIANSGTSSVTIAGSIADIHTYLDAVSKIEVTTATNSLSGITLTITPNDGVLSGTPATSTLSVTSVNDEPTLTATASNPIYTENGSAASLFTNAAVSTIESGQAITALTVSVTNVDDTNNEVLNLDGSAISLVVGSGTTATNNFAYSVAVVGTTATVTLSGGSVADASVQTLVNAISYQNNSEKPTTTDTRIVTLTSISDDGGTANGGDFVATISVSSTVTVVAVNDIPVIANLDGDSFTYNEDSGAVIIDQTSALTLTDVDSTDFDGGNITVTIIAGKDVAEDILSFDTSGVVTLAATTASSNVSVNSAVIGTLANNIAAGNDLVVNLNANATPINVETLLKAITYNNTDSGAPTTGARNVRTTVTDDDGGISANNDVTITVTGVNDAADIGGDLTGGTIEDNGTGATGSLTVTDVDTNESTFTAQTANTTTYGTFSVDTSGNWTYDLDNAKSTVQALANGATMTDIITITSVDGTQKQITITITGINGVATITGISAGAATEDDATQVTGSLSIADEDTGEAIFIAQINTAGTYGAFNLATGGNWTYDLDSTKAAVQALPNGATLTDSFTATSADSTDSQLVTITITGVNGVATITGTSTGAATEDDATQITGSLSIADEDTGEAVFVAQTNAAGTYGAFNLATSGNWTYDLDSTKAAVQALPNGATLTDSFTATSADGTDLQVVTVIITGVNGIATITGTSTGAATEDNSTQVTGSLSITDEDTGEAVFVAQTNAAGSYGAFNLATSGNWTYDLDSTKAAVQALPNGATLTDSFTATSADSTDLQLVTITITGVNGVATITGTSTGAATEDDATQITGSLSIADEDTGEAIFVAQTNTVGTYGGFTLSVGGNWTYDLDSTKAAVQALPNGSTLTDSFTATSADSTDSQLVTITITGVNGVATITGTSTGAATEDDATQITGSLSIADEDTGEAVFIAQTNAARSYGAFNLATSGNWTYDLDSTKAAVQALPNGSTLTDSFTATSLDSTDSQLVTITITGVNGVATITGTSTGAATEDDATQITGSLSIADEDTGEAVFIAQTNAAGSYGAFNLATSGNWTYDLDNTRGVVQALPNGSILTDSFTASSADGTDSQVVTVTIIGVNGTATITGTSTGAATEDDATQITGSLSIADEDTGEAVFVAQTNSEGSYGFFSLTLTGTWSYQLDGSNLDVQILPEGETLKDSFTVSSIDDTDSQVVTITITGINDVATITGTSIADTNEDNRAQITGSLSITDKDIGEAIFMMQSGVAGAYGIFNIDNQGNWTFTLDNDNVLVQQMSSGEQLTDSFTAMSIDGSDSQTITVTVFGANDAPNAEHDDITVDVSVNGVYVINVLGNDSDVDGDVLSIVGANTSLGTVSTNGESLTLTTQAGFVGQVALTYTITDRNNAFSETTVNVEITGALNETAPVITVPETVEVNAEGLYTKVDLGVATALNSQGQPVPISLVDGEPLFKPGNSIAYWQATDLITGLTTVASQKVIVHPIISLGKDQVVVEGKKVSVDIILNGEAPTYPVVIALSISGSVDDNDYAIETQEVTIESGTQTSVLIDIVQDNVIEGDETLSVSLSEGNISDRATQIITIVERNIVPKVTLSSSQNAEDRQLVTPAGGLVTIDAIVVDANDDNVSTQWSSELNINEIDDFTLTLDPSELSSGIYSIDITVVDDGEGKLSTTQTIYLEVIASLAVLTDVDSDGDLIPDNEEGYGDSDQDGIPDFQDAIAKCNVMPEQVLTQNRFLVEGEPGVCLRKGNTLAEGETGGLQLTDNDLDNSIGLDEVAVIVGGVFDYIATGLPQAGQNYQIVLPQVQPIPTGAVYRKYNETRGWENFFEDVNNQLHSAAGEMGYCPPPGNTQWSTGLTEGHWCLQLTIEDGGLNDNDGLANGTIVDPGGVSVMITGNAMPVAQADIVTLKWNDSILIDVLANDSDADGDALSIGVATATFGSVTITADNQLNYQSQTDFIGLDTIVYSLSDGKGGTSSGTVSITVYAYENVTVNNKSKGGSMGLIIISLIGVTLYRLCRKKNIGKKQLVQGAAALTVATSMSLAAAEPQWFMTGSVGKSHANSHVNIPSDIGITDSELDKSSTSYTVGGGVNYGVYSFTVSYEQLGDSSASYDGDVIDTALFHQTLANVVPKLVEGISLQGQYTLWQGDALSASIGVGLFAWELDYTSTLNDSVIKVNEDDVDFIYNLQVAYAITEQVQVSVKASRYSLSVNDINNIALGLTYHF